MADKKLRVGVIGSGFGSVVHIPAYQSEDVEVAAVWSRSKERVEETAQKHGIPRALTDYQELLRMDDIDAVSIVSPVAYHYEMTMAALDAGKHVLCEKPFALNQQQAKEMWQKAESKGLTAMIAHEFRFASARQRVKELIDEGYLGGLHMAVIELANGPRTGGFESRPLSDRDDASRGAGQLFSMGSHYIDCLRHWFGEITSVSGHLESHGGERTDASGATVRATADDTFNFVVTFAGGGWATMTGSGAAPFGPGARVEIFGHDGTLITPHTGTGNNPPSHGTIFGAKVGAEKLEMIPIPAHLEPFDDDRDDRLMPMRLLVREFRRGIEEGTSPAPNFYDGYRCQQVLDAVRESSASGRVVTIPPVE